MSRPRLLAYVLALSLSLNLGVLAAVGYRALASGHAAGFGEGSGLVKHLGLSDVQQQQWRDAELVFLEEFEPRSAEIREHRDRLVRAIFADRVDRQAIEDDRARIAELQEQQQRLVIEQLLRERELLDKDQRERLVKLLLEQTPGAEGFEQLHRD